MTKTKKKNTSNTKKSSAKKAKPKSQTKKRTEPKEEIHYEWNYDEQKEERQAIGRKTKMTKNMVEKLEEYFSLAYTDDEACFSAGIDKKTLYNYADKYPSFSTKKEQLKKNPNIKAKKILINALNSDDVNSAKWWLERKCKDEFSTRVESTAKDGKDFNFTQLKIINPNGEVKLK